MMNKGYNKCIIIQDLLPNYIEKLTSDETKQYIKEHLKRCKKCQKILKNMKGKNRIIIDNEYSHLNFKLCLIIIWA